MLQRQLSLPGAIKALPGGARVTGLGAAGAEASTQAPGAADGKGWGIPFFPWGSQQLELPAVLKPQMVDDGW